MEPHRPAPTSGGSGGDEDDAAPVSAEQAAQEVLHACGRATSGSLDDVAGLHNIKQLLREASTLAHCWAFLPALRHTIASLRASHDVSWQNSCVGVVS